MKKSDLIAVIFILAAAGIFVYQPTYRSYNQWYAAAPALLSFVKFAVLATFGEMLVVRIQKGRYLPPQFGLIPKALVWGVLGVAIWIAFGIFSKGVTGTFFAGVQNPGVPLQVVMAFSISFFMNIVFAPLMMLSHHLTDMYIAKNEGHFPLKGFQLMPLLHGINWEKMWGFVYKKTIPLFWIPAHTITFLLPENMRVLFAVLLSVFLGLLLTVKK